MSTVNSNKVGRNDLGLRNHNRVRNGWGWHEEMGVVCGYYAQVGTQKQQKQEVKAQKQHNRDVRRAAIKSSKQ